MNEGKDVNIVYRILVSFLLSVTVAAAPVHLTKTGSEIAVTVSGKPFTTYYFGADVAKPYLMPLRTAQGIVISRDFPVGNDASGGDPKASSFEPHQRPLYFAHGDIDGLNYWAESVFRKYYGGHSTQDYGRSTLTRFDEVREAGDYGIVKGSFSLLDPKGRVIGEETQTFTFRGDSATRIIDCEFTLKATQGPMVIGDTKEGTFAIRVSRDLSAPLGHMINSRGAEGEPAIWGQPADWVDYYGASSGHPIGIAVFDHPRSFRHPTTWHARGYGLLAANPFGRREFTKDPMQDGSWTVEEKGVLTFRYRVFIYDGELTPAQIAQQYVEYAKQ